MNITWNNAPVEIKINKFPDGQQDCVIGINEGLSYVDTFKITSRFNGFKDLELILCATASLKRLGAQRISLEIPYLLGARCDRQFEIGGTSYLRDVVSPIINAQSYDSVISYDIHNLSVADACINNLKAIDNSKLVSWAWANVGDAVACCPDEGASKKIYPLFKKIGYSGDVIICSKNRELDGSITSTTVNNLHSFKKKNVLIIDDICDGGRTFTGIAKKLLEMYECKIYLVVSHGIFSAGFDELEKYFSGIFCTNSISDITHPLVNQIKII